MQSWNLLDRQMMPWSSKLTDDLDLPARSVLHLATTIASDVANLAAEDKARLLSAGPVAIEDRLAELQAFDSWMEMASASSNPAVVRAQVLTQNYVCFVYLRDDWFHVLGEVAPVDSATAHATMFLTSDPVRAFRNAFAHGSWRYRQDFRALEFWARRNGRGEIVSWEVDQDELNFWQALSRVTAYASIQTLTGGAV